MGEKIRVSNFGAKEGEYETKYDWECFCQSGSNGIVFSKKSNRKTAFFEAFPNNPKCFIRGEGATVEEAEQKAWEEWQKIQTCKHEMERRDRTDGYAFCKHCSYSATVFEPLTKCCKCKKPTAYAEDSRGNSYCKKHARVMPKALIPEWLHHKEKKLPRKLKKVMKYGVSMLIYKQRYGKIKVRSFVFHSFTGNGYRYDVVYSGQKRNVIELGKTRRPAVVRTP
jgi:hypothetical protein